MLAGILLVIISALLTALAFPPLNLFWLAFFSLMPLFYAFYRAENYRQVFFYGALFALIFYLTLLVPIGAALCEFAAFYWLFLLGVAVYLYLAFFLVGSLLLAKFVQKQPVSAGFGSVLWSISACALGWILFDWLRSLGAFRFTLGSLACTQYLFLDFIQLARHTGSYGLTFILIFINACGGIFLARLKTAAAAERRSWAALGSALAAAFCLLLLGGRLSLSAPARPAPETKQVAVFQPAIPQQDKLSDDASALKRRYLSALRAYAVEHAPDLLVLPETIVPAFLLEDRDFLFQLRDSLNSSLVFGTPRREKKGELYHLYNSAALLNRYGAVTLLHDKKYLVPFGEYLPLRRLLYPLLGKTGFYDLVYLKGSANQPSAGYSAAICYESIFPYQLREQIRSGGRLIFVLTNDAWFGRSLFLDMHLAFGVLRAVENNRYLVQAANTGRSFIVDNRGRILRQSNIDEQEFILAETQMLDQKTLYTYCGELPIYLALVFFFLYGYLFLLRKFRA
ncbi:MAG: apolipoprotein N-acyltransferase [Candidatus Margulisbacteria bacterium]|jgi:apolipoprotein N-acyltransferase|nr:apolipoprotein N-acyltransferase [Candidatus Margulisiibacteriota bacterium]